MLFQRITAYKIVSEHIRDYSKIFPVCKIKILQVTVNKIEYYYLFILISDDFWLKVAKKGTLVSSCCS